MPRNFRSRGRVTRQLSDEFDLLEDDILPKERNIPTAPPAAPLPGYTIVQKGDVYVIRHEE